MACRSHRPGRVTPADTAFAGTARAFQSSLRGLGLLLLLAILVIYLVLGVLYESFIHPLTILSALPFAGFGRLRRCSSSTSSCRSTASSASSCGRLGQEERHHDGRLRHRAAQEGKSPEEAIREACLVRFRPITMTTMAALVGTLPIAMGYGAGAESRQPLGLAVVGGLLFSQVLTLYVTPVVYVYVERFQGWLDRHVNLGRSSDTDTPSPVAPHA